MFNVLLLLGSVCKTLYFYLWYFTFVTFNMSVCSSLAHVNPSIFLLKNFDSSVSNSPTCGLINFTIDSSTLWANKLVPLWINFFM